MVISRTSKSNGPGSPEVVGFYDDDTGSIQYVVIDKSTGKAALIDIVQTFDVKSASISTQNADMILSFVKAEQLKVEWVLDTHPHADHLLASAYLRDQLQCPNAIGEKVKDVAQLWQKLYHFKDSIAVEDHFDRLFKDGDTFSIGNLSGRVMFTPGHTMASLTYIVGNDAAFVNDTFMQPDSGTARTDFPGGSTSQLYQSLQKILSLSPETRLFVGHDYGTKYRKMPEWVAAVEDHKRHNIHLRGNVSEDEYVTMRQERDKSLALPDRMLHVLQMNLRAGRMPEEEDDGHAYLKIPLNKF
jgi:glyoxylase-like metal-dependent hydrolase (beta-lactamase superfamily II)